MNSKRDAYRGCLLGLAIGDAMGYPADTKTWLQIQEDYGPYGLMGYDLRNGYAEVSSHTQLAAFSCNGLLLGLTRGQVFGKMAPLVRYVHLAQQEWAVGQRRYDQPGRNHCWVFRVSDLRHRHCTDTRMVETLNRSRPGSLEEPVNRYDTPAIMSAEQTAKDIAFIQSFVGAMANAKCCPVAREIPDSVKEKLDIYNFRKRPNK